MEALKNPVSVCKWEIAPFPLQRILGFVWILRQPFKSHLQIKIKIPLIYVFRPVRIISILDTFLIHTDRALNHMI